MEDKNNMTVKEISRLVKWLKIKKFSAEEILECIDYIANSNPKKEKGQEPVEKKS